MMQTSLEHAVDPPSEESFDPDGDRLREECGVFGIFGHPEAAAITALGLHALQHRGQEAAGMVGGSLLLNGIRGMMGGSHHGFGDASALGKGSSGSNPSSSPWSDQSNSSLARDAGISQATGYRYLHEGIDVLAAHAPDLHTVLEGCRSTGMSHVILDGTRTPPAVTANPEPPP